MTISIQLQTSEDLKLIEPLLQMLRQFEVSVNIIPDSPISRRKKSPRSSKPLKGISERLHGVVQLPAEFDYKASIAAELLHKYGFNG